MEENMSIHELDQNNQASGLLPPVESEGIYALWGDSNTGDGVIGTSNKPGPVVLLVLNFLTTALRIGWCLFFLGVLFVLIVSLFSGTEDQLFPTLGSLFSPANPQRASLLIVYLVFVALSVLVGIIRWFARDWIARFSKDGEHYLLTWKKLRETKIRRAIIQGMWGVFQVIWVGLILAVVLPLATNLLGDKPEVAINTTIVQFIGWVSGPNLNQRLVLYAIVTFIFLSLIVRLVAHSQPKEENIVSVKQLEPVHKSLDAVSKQLQELSQDFVNRLLEDTDEQIIKGLTEKIVEPLQQQFEEEKVARQCLEEQVQQLLQQTNPLSIPVAPKTQLQTEVTQRLNWP